MTEPTPTPGPGPAAVAVDAVAAASTAPPPAPPANAPPAAPPATVSRRSAMRRLGKTAAAFALAARRLGLRPDADGRWAAADIARLAAGPEMAAAGRDVRRRRKLARRLAEAVEAAAQELPARFPDWRDAIMPAARAVTRLNHAAKKTDDGKFTARVYAAKTALALALHGLGYTRRLARHRRGPETSLLVFVIRVKGEDYAWHVPAGLAPPEVVAAAGGVVEGWRERPVKLKGGRRRWGEGAVSEEEVVEGLALVEFVVGAARAEGGKAAGAGGGEGAGAGPTASGGVAHG